VQQLRFAEVAAQQLHADRQATGEAGGQGDTGNACQIGGGGVDVGQVQVHRIIDIFAHRKGWRRGGGTDDHVHSVEFRHEIILDHPTDLLRLQVVGIVIAGGQGVGAHHDTALYLVAEALGAGAQVQVVEVRGVLAAVAEAHAVETRQVGGRLGGR